MMIVMKSVSKKRVSNPQHFGQLAKILFPEAGIDYQFKTCKKIFHPRLFLNVQKTLLSIDFTIRHIHQAKQKSDSTFPRL